MLEDNHLPIYPYEVWDNSSCEESLASVIQDAFYQLCSAKRKDIFHVKTIAKELAYIFSQAKKYNLHLSLCYHRAGMYFPQYYLYTAAIKKY